MLERNEGGEKEISEGEEVEKPGGGGKVPVPKKHEKRRKGVMKGRRSDGVTRGRKVKKQEIRRKGSGKKTQW